jgi:chromosome segregation ATPase
MERMHQEPIHHQLDRIERKLNIVLLLEGRIMADEQGLDDAITALSAQQDELDAAVQSIIDKLSGVTEVDLSDEIASLQAIQGKAKDATDAITAAVTPAPEPTP